MELYGAKWDYIGVLWRYIGLEKDIRQNMAKKHLKRMQNIVETVVMQRSEGYAKSTGMLWHGATSAITQLRR